MPGSSGELAQAINSGNMPSVEKLVGEGAPLESEWQEYTPLVRAASQGKTEVVEYLLDKGVDVNAATSNGITALHEAGKPEIALLLYEAGAKTNPIVTKLLVDKGTPFDFVRKSVIEELKGQDLGYERPIGEEKYARHLNPNFLKVT